MPGVLPMGFKAERIQVSVNQRKTRAGASETHIVQRAVPNHDNQIWERCQLAWKLRLEGAGIKEIMEATRLFKTPGGYSTFFKNRIYTGDFDYGGNRYVDFVPAIVSREQFEAEQQQREVRAAKRMKKPINPSEEPRALGSRHLLSGLVFCNAVDGEEHPMHADTVPEKEGKRTRWDFYMCTTKKNTKNVYCNSSRISAKALEEAVIDALMNDVLKPANLRPIADSMAKMLSERNDDVMARIQAVQGQLDQVRKGISQLLDAIEKAGFSSSIQGRLADREEEERKLIAQLVNLEDLIVEPDAIAAVSEQQINEWVDGIRQALTGEDVELARKAIRQFVAKVVMNEKAGTIYYTFPLSSLSRVGLMPHTEFESVFSP
ncbi:MAG: recombinase zinc beta ribbon domain-containing protein [Anaerolinea sp.]|nr:recombinase zinc beta ribbon domain-containing protein [Anaerolinea sp.]